MNRITRYGLSVNSGVVYGICIEICIVDIDQNVNYGKNARCSFDRCISSTIECKDELLSLVSHRKKSVQNVRHGSNGVPVLSRSELETRVEGFLRVLAPQCLADSGSPGASSSASTIAGSVSGGFVDQGA